MSKMCAITNVRSQVGGRYSNATRATKFNPTGKVRRQPNLRKKRIFIPELNKTVILLLSARAIKTIAKNGAFQTLRKAGIV